MRLLTIRNAPLVSALFLCTMSSAYGALILSLTDPLQSVRPGAHAVYHGTITNNSNTAFNLIAAPVIAFPSDNRPSCSTSDPFFPLCPFPFSQPAFPFLLTAGGVFTGTLLDIAVPEDALIQIHTFSIAVATDQHDAAGISIGSNGVSASLIVVPESNTFNLVLAFLGTAAICVRVRCSDN